jgi:hypothetical protein
MNQSLTELQQNTKDLIICANLNREVIPDILKNLDKIQKLNKNFLDDPKLMQLIEKFSSLIKTHIYEPQNEYIVWYQQTFADALNVFLKFVKDLTNNNTNNDALLELMTILQDTYNIQKDLNKIIG